MTGPKNLTRCKDDYHKKLVAHGIERRYWNCTFDQLRTYPTELSNAIQRCKNYADKFETYKRRGIGLLMKGPVGTMKTTLAVAILQETIQHYGGGYFISMASLLDKMLTMGKKGSPEDLLNFESRIRNTPLLLLDDLGTEYQNNWVITKVDAIISERYNRMLPIIITTNLNADGLMGQYQERIYDRLKSTSLVLNFNGVSQRQGPKWEDDKE